MQDLNDMLYFAEVVERGGFAAAGRALGIPKSRLSRRVSDLETQLGVRLLQRTTRKLSLTEVADVLGVPMFAGRAFRTEEEKNATQVAVLGYSFWQRRFHGDTGVLDRKLNLNGHDFTVIGIAPPRFGGAYVGLGMDLYLPVTTRTVLDGGRPFEERGWQWLDAIARLKSGVTLATAGEDMSRVAQELDALYPRDQNQPVLAALRSQGASAVLLPVMAALLGVTALVLLATFGLTVLHLRS